MGAGLGRGRVRGCGGSFELGRPNSARLRRFNGAGIRVDFGIPCTSLVTNSYRISVYDYEHDMPSVPGIWHIVAQGVSSRLPSGARSDVSTVPAYTWILAYRGLSQHTTFKVDGFRRSRGRRISNEMITHLAEMA